MQISESKWLEALDHEKRFWDLYVSPSGERFIPGTDADFWYQIFEKELTHLGSVTVEIGSGPRGLSYYGESLTKVWIDPLLPYFVDRGFTFPADVLLIQARGEQIPIRQDACSSVLCINVLDHTYRPFRVLHSIHRILAPGGQIILAVDLRSREDQLIGPHTQLIKAEELLDFFIQRSYQLLRFERIPARMKELDGCAVIVALKSGTFRQSEAPLLLCPVCGSAVEKRSEYRCTQNHVLREEKGVLLALSLD